ncbi:MAG: DUF222 domain-containing protein [bacterium]|nr:DUF222 domain-containing protein [bacterium]
MRGQIERLSAAVATLSEACESALPAALSAGADGPAGAGQMTDAGLVAVLRAVGEVTKQSEALSAVIAGEIARRSPIEARGEGLAKRSGFSTPGRMVAASRGGKVGRGAELVKVGEGTAPRQSLTGEELPAAHPHVAAALHAGDIGVDAAHLIITMLDRVSARANPVELEATEELLARQAAEFPLEQLEKLVKYAEARLDPDGLAPKEEDQYAARSLVMREDANGMLHLRGMFDPVTGAPIKLALQDYAEARMREARGNNAPGAPEGAAGAVCETRTVAQIQADGLADFIAHVRGCDQKDFTMSSVTMVVRVDLQDLECRLGGAGIATIDGIGQPISAEAARKLAANAHLIPAVFDGDSVPLDLGRTARTFTRSQVHALWERDGGCAKCGQTQFVEAHHVKWWWRHGGRTDLGNGVLLCSRCHHTIHRDEWEIHLRGNPGEVWFIPPAHVDPGREPRRAAANPRRRASPAA